MQLPTKPTKQEILDYSACHLFTQNRANINTIFNPRNTIYCSGPRYRTQLFPGLAAYCPIGIWIDDKSYDPSIEGETIEALIDANCTNIIPSWMTKHKELLVKLQDIHDFKWNWNSDGSAGEFLRGMLKKLAKQNSLKVTTINKLQPGKPNHVEVFVPKKKVRRSKGKRTKGR